MKKLLFLLALSLSACLSQAQPYQSIFGQHSTMWSMAFYNSGSGGVIHFHESKDTLFNGYLYKNISDDYGYTQALLREDTITGKVWLQQIDQYNLPERLVIDMSLNVGDTFNTKPYLILNGNMDDSMIVVDSVFYAFGQKHVRFRVNSLWSGNEQLTFVEGISTTYGPLWKLLRTTYSRPYLLCAYKDSIQQNYTNQRFSGDCDPLIESIEAISASHKGLYPNPASGTINIPAVNDPAIYSISNSVRQVVKTGQISNAEKSIAIDEIPTGYYLISVYSADRMVGCYRFVKTN